MMMLFDRAVVGEYCNDQG